MTGFQRLCLVTCVVVFGLIVLGGVVRATDSGLGCGDDWPRCEGSFIPRLETELLIEYSHRLTASVAGLLILSIAVWAWRSYRRVPAILYPALLTFGLVLLQGGLGAAAVRNELDPQVVALHLGLALTILTLLVLITMTSFAIERPPAAVRTPRNLASLATLALGGTLALMLVGSYVSGAGYGLACNGWPLCNGEVVPTTEADSVQTVFLHRVLAAFVGVFLVALAWSAWRVRTAMPLVAALAAGALAIFVVQSLVGAANVWTRLADEVTGSHLALGTLLWLTLAALNIHVHRLYELLPRDSRAGAKNDLAEAAR
jgi:cytochrome c oxidase assembly protein subunit 15